MKKLMIIAMLFLTGCATQYNWVLDKVNKYHWKEPVVETVTITDLSQYPEAHKKPSTQTFRAIFEDGAFQITLRHEADHWGDAGTGAGTVCVGDEPCKTINVNVLIRKQYAQSVAITAPIPIPAGDYNWRRWETEQEEGEPKTMLMSDGIDLHALKVLVVTAPDFGIEGELIEAESVEVKR